MKMRVYGTSLIRESNNAIVNENDSDYTIALKKLNKAQGDELLNLRIQKLEDIVAYLCYRLKINPNDIAKP